jgi:E3 ubiquitin-protein ligase RNF13
MSGFKKTKKSLRQSPIQKDLELDLGSRRNHEISCFRVLVLLSGNNHTNPNLCFYQRERCVFRHGLGVALFVSPPSAFDANSHILTNNTMSQSSGVWVPTLSRSALFLLLACLHFLPTQSAVLVQSGNLTLNTLSDMPANFGPSVPPEGVVGLLLLAAPDDEACEPLNTPQAGKKQPWIALIARSHDRDGCTFDVKVRNAAAAGAVAAIVHDDTTEALLIMAKPPRHPHPSIPAVFISVESGLLLRKLMNAEKIHVIITPLADVLWVSMLLSACAGALAVSLLLGAFWWVRRPILMVEGRRGFHRSHGAPRIVMTSEQLRALPTILHGDPALPCLAPLESPAAASSVANSTVESCVVCLERYQVGEKLRVLPCNHRYHAACIDQVREQMIHAKINNQSCSFGERLVLHSRFDQAHCHSNI